MILWRLAPWDPTAPLRERGGGLWFPRELQGYGRHDNPDRYGCLYAAQAPLSPVVEALAPFRGTGRLSAAMLVRAGQPLALVEFSLAESGSGHLVDLDDPGVLARNRLRPSRVATGQRTATQAYAARIFAGQRRALGLRWWSTLEASLMNVTLYDRAATLLTLVGSEQLTLTHPAVSAAAEMLGLARAS